MAENSAIRSMVRTAVLGARTIESVAAAEKLVEEWLRDHPDDFALRREADQLVRMRGALEQRGGANGRPA